jgi:hypothetical protein
MKDYSDDIDFLLDDLLELKNYIKDPEILYLKKQYFMNWFNTIIEEVYQNGIYEGLDHEWK